MGTCSCLRTSAFFLIIILLFGTAATARGQDLSAGQLRGLGKQAFDEGRFVEAERQFLRALDEATKGGDPLVVVQTLGDLATTLVAEQRIREAEQLLDRALTMVLRQFGEYRRETSRFLSSLGALYEQTGRRPLAEDAFKKSLTLLEQYEPNDPHTAIVLSNLSTLYVQNGDYKKGRAHLEKALAFAEKRGGSDHPDLIPVLVNFAALHQKQKKWAPAESFLLRAARIAEQSLRPDHPNRALIFEHLGVVHHRQGKLHQAEMELRRALEMDRAAFGTESGRSVSPALNLAKLLTTQRRYDEARALYSDVLPVQERLLGSKSPEVATTLETFAGLLRAMKSDKPAEEMAARARRIRAELAYTRSVKVGP